jgi:hypothetical protein
MYYLLSNISCSNINEGFKSNLGLGEPCIIDTDWDGGDPCDTKNNIVCSNQEGTYGNSPGWGTCVCKEGMVVDPNNTSKCVCPPGQIMNNGTCVCPHGQTINTITGICECPSDQITYGETCTCIDVTKTVDTTTGKCTCLNGMTLNTKTGSCNCPTNFYFDNNYNVCLKLP